MIEWDVLGFNVIGNQLNNFWQVLKTLVDEESLVLRVQVEASLLVRLGPCQVNKDAKSITP